MDRSNHERIRRVLRFVQEDMKAIDDWNEKYPIPTDDDFEKFAHEYASHLYKMVTEYEGGPGIIRGDIYTFATYMKSMTPLIVTLLSQPWPFDFGDMSILGEPTIDLQELSESDILSLLRGHRV